jgi:hypothetical protein
LYRRVHTSYQEHYDLLMQSGLYTALVTAGLLIPHEEVQTHPAGSGDIYRVLRPERVAFISYPYEWCFSQLRDAALATLKIQQMALEHGMVLKDASAYNMQFHCGKPLLIDTLSFERCQPGRPWIAYRQFCQHFLAPLALMANCDIRLNQLLRIFIDGVPLDLVSRLLPRRSWLRSGLAMHLHVHGRMQQNYGGKKVNTTQRSFSDAALRGLIDNLRATVNGLHWKPQGTEWADYYNDTNYTQVGADSKRRLVKSFLDTANPKQVWDLGANNGFFSRLASERGIPTVAFDVDPAAVEKCYLDACARQDANLLPLVQDLTNPSPALGWANEERTALVERGPADLVMALALIHHLAISNNVPFGMLADFFARTGCWLIIEFVPKDDSQVARLLVSREDIFCNYTQEHFEQEFSRCFTIEANEPVADSGRRLYLMRRKEQ